MKHTTPTIYILAIVACLSFTTVASATNTHRYPSPTYRAVNIELLPTVSFFGALNTSIPIFSGTLFVPIQTPTLLSRQSGGDHDNDNDTTSDNDTINGGGGHGDNDSTDTDNGGGHHGNDSTDVDDDSTGHHDNNGGGDSTDIGDNNGDDSNDTLECGGHGHHDGNGDNDSLEVNDTSSRSMFKGGHQSIVIKTSGSKTFVTFKFTNDLATKIDITHLALANGINFSIVSAMPTVAKPIKLAAGASILVKIAFSAPDAIRHTDQLQINSTGSTTQTVVSLEGIKINPTSSVSTTIPAGVSVSMTPNPMSSILKINVSGARNTAVAIYDMMGKQIFSQNINADFQWNGYSNDGMQLANGTFIARLSGESTEGKAFVISQKIILQR